MPIANKIKRVIQNPFLLISALTNRILYFYKLHVIKDEYTVAVTKWFRDRGDETLRLNYPITRDSIVFDLGGYKGDFAADINNKYSCHVYVFEPVKRYYLDCVNRFRGNKKIKCFNYGLSNQQGSFLISEDNDSSSLIKNNTFNTCEKVLVKSSIKWSVARTIIVYGIVDNMSRSNIVLWAKDALTKGQNINVVDDQFRSPTLAEDLADGCILIADKNATGIYHLSGPNTMSILELVYVVADYWKLDKSLITPSKSTNLNQAAKRPPRTGFDISKAKRELGYNPHSFSEGLAILDLQLPLS